MQNIKNVILSFWTLFFLLNALANSTIDYAELISKDGIYLDPVEKQPYTGEVNGNPSGELIEGKKNGPWIEVYENGQLFWHGNFRDGLAESDWAEYHRNGQIFAQGKFVRGKKDGVWKYYSKAGKLIAREFYNKGSNTKTEIIK